MSHFLALFALLILSFSVSAQSFDQLVSQVEVYLQGERYDKAVKPLERMVELRPDSLDLYAQLGRAICLSGDLEGGLEVFAAGLKKDPEYAMIFMNRGYCYHQYRQYDKAVMDYSEGLSYADSDTLIMAFYIERAVSKEAYMDAHGAIEDNLKALGYDSLNLAIHINLGIQFAQVGEYDKGEYHLRKSLEIDSTFAGGLLNLGFFYSQQEEYERALEILDLAIDRFPEQAVAYNNRGMIRHRLGDSIGGLDDVVKSIDMYPANSYAFRNQAIILKETDDTAAACESCRRALELGFTTNYGEEMNTFYKDNCSK